MFGSSLYVNLTCGPPFVIILIISYRNRHSQKLMEIVRKNPKSMVKFSFYPLSSPWLTYNFDG